MNIKIALLLHNIRSTQNVGSILRSADCFGIDHVYFSGYTPYPAKNKDPRLPYIKNKIHKRIIKTSLGTEKNVKFSTYINQTNAIEQAKKDNYQIIACLEQDPKSTKIQYYKPNKNILLIVGNEITGVTKNALNLSDIILEIPQFGKKESLNVSNATAIALYSLRTSSYEQNT